jgi:hypothetical protein
MLDANQAWSLEEARRIAPELEAFDIGWLDEPLRADQPFAEWQVLRRATRIPLAAGEKLIGEDAFDAAFGAGALAVVPPDVAKWGGISGCWPVIERIRAAGLRYCPHYLGGGVGLLAATGSTGWLEIDANINPLRTFPQCLPHRYRRRQRAARRVCRHRQSTSTWRSCPPSAPPPELSIHLRRTGRRRETPAIAAPAPRGLRDGRSAVEQPNPAGP